jgi:hypothetical protein
MSEASTVKSIDDYRQDNIPLTTYPPAITTAIIEVMSKVKRLGRKDHNNHYKYNFAGIDNFLEAVNPLCAETGLIIMASEVSRQIEKTQKADKQSVWLLLEFDFTLAHASGAYIASPMRRSVMVPAEGAQAFGSAQSYALKQFMRSLFMIPTGEGDDADFRQATALPTSNEAVDKEQADQLRKLAEQTNADLEKFCAYFAIETLEQLPAAKFSTAMAMLKKKQGGQE